MLRLRNWILPLLALALAIGFTAVRATAEEAKKETGTVSGVVQDKDGKPVAGAEVGIFHATGKHAAADKPKTEAKNPAEKPEKANSVVPMVKSDDKGEFTLSDVPVGDYTVIARLRGQGQGRENVTVKAGETAKVELKLKKNAPKTGGTSEKKPESAAK
jgi:hypothetical protein